MFITILIKQTLKHSYTIYSYYTNHSRACVKVNTIFPKIIDPITSLTYQLKFHKAHTLTHIQHAKACLGNLITSIKRTRWQKSMNISCPFHCCFCYENTFHLIERPGLDGPIFQIVTKKSIPDWWTWPFPNESLQNMGFVGNQFYQ